MKMFIPFLVSFIISVAIMPVIMKYAKKHDIVDKPDERKIHKKPIPLLGGLGMLIAFIIPLLVFATDIYRALMITLSLVLITILGILDDIYDIRANKKLAVQLICTTIIVIAGIKIDFARFIISNLFLANIIDIIISFLWIIGITNAINLVDGLDGLAGGVSLISAIGFWIVGAISKGNSVVLLASLLAGSVLGFLFYNFNPARIFMGDAGSTFLGLCLAIIALLIPKYSVDKSSLYAPILILALPIFETGVSILRRSFMKQNILTADKQHLHHKLLDMGFSQKMAVGIIYALSIFSMILGVVVYNTKQHKLGIVFIIIYMLYGIGISVKGAIEGETIAQIAATKDRE